MYAEQENILERIKAKILRAEVGLVHSFNAREEGGRWRIPGTVA